jgi:Tfp pilus assembly protein PilX
MQSFIKLYRINNSENGQALVIMLMIMVVGLTVGLSLMSRTTTDISLTTKITDSSRAFNAAEAGIEEAIRLPQISPSPVSISTGVNFTPIVGVLGGTNTIYPAIKQTPTKLGEVFTIWLARHNDATGDLDETISYIGNDIDVCIDNNGSNTPNMIISLYYRQGSAAPYTYKTSYVYFPSTSYLTVDDNCLGYDHMVTISLNTSFGILGSDIFYLALRVRPVLYDTYLAANPLGDISVAFPKQGTNIDSTGTAGDTSRKINVRNPYSVLPAFMDYAVYSTSGDIAK